MTSAGFPHSGTAGSKDVCSYPASFAAYCALHRLFAPRHPPYALCSLTKPFIQVDSQHRTASSKIPANRTTHPANRSLRLRMRTQYNIQMTMNIHTSAHGARASDLCLGSNRFRFHPQPGTQKGEDRSPSPSGFNVSVCQPLFACVHAQMYKHRLNGVP